jgi:Ca-activated chloride channel family protein
MKTLPLIIAAYALLANLTYASQPDLTPPQSKTLTPYFIVLGDESEGESEPLPLKRTDVEVTISGIIADVEVRQTYHNTGSKILEAIYVFPGSTRAAVHGLDMKIGDRSIAAEIHERAAAKKIYETAKAENKTAALLEQERPNVFRMQVGHILPGDLVEVTLHYSEVVVPTERTYEFVFPTVVAPRFSNTPADSPSGKADQWVSNPYLKNQHATEHASDFDIRVHLKAGMPIQAASCATHSVRIDYENADTATVVLDTSQANEAMLNNRDFVFHYQLAGDAVNTGLLLHEDNESGENFFLLTVQPPERIAPDKIPAREYIFLVDVSGSMNGFPLDTTKELLSNLVTTLRPTDRFNLILFAASSRKLESTSLSATPKNLQRALDWLDQDSGRGGTQLTKGLRRALDVPSVGGMSRSIVVITDGMVSFERETFDLVRRELGNANLFSFGIGSSVNRFLIEGLARCGQGEPFVVLHPDQSAEVTDRFRAYISAPALTDIRVKFHDFDAYDLEPQSFADVFADRPIQIVGKYRGDLGAGVIELSGVTGDGKKTQRIDLAELLEKKTDTTDNPALASLWARQRVARLADDIELGAGDEAKLEVTNLGLSYHLLTEYTSFVGVDSVAREMPEDTGKDSVTQPLPLPAKVSHNAVGGGSIPEPSMSLLLLLALIVLALQRPRRIPQHG